MGAIFYFGSLRVNVDHENSPRYRTYRCLVGEMHAKVVKDNTYCNLVELQRRSHFDNSSLDSDAGSYSKYLPLGHGDPLPGHQHPRKNITTNLYEGLARATSTQAWVELGVTNAVHVGHHMRLNAMLSGGVRRPPPTRER
jgi:hypothetical protein